MSSQNQGSCNSTPFNPNKENLCPNHNYNTSVPFCKKDKKKQHNSNSIRTDSQFNMFRTINVQRQSQTNTVGTKSRMQMEAILQNFSTKSESKRRMSEYSHRSFLQLLGLAFGREQLSVDEAIEKCEEYCISGRQQLLSLIQQKQPSRQWPLPLSNLLLTDLGHLKVMKICQHIQDQQELSDRELQILQFLVPNLDQCELLDRTLVLQSYNEFRNQIDQKCSHVDDLVRGYTLKVHPKIKKITDKVALIKLQKKIKRLEKNNNGAISFSELKSCIELFQLTDEEMALAFKYLYFLQNEKVISLVDPKLTITCSTCYRQLLDKHEETEIKPTMSTLHTYEEENTQVINQLLTDKNYLLETINSQKDQIAKLKNQVMMLQMELQHRQRQAWEEKEREIANIRKRCQKKIEGLQQQNKEKDQLIRWYKTELSALVDEKKKEFIANNRHRVFYNVIKSTEITNQIYPNLKGSSFSDISNQEQQRD